MARRFSYITIVILIISGGISGYAASADLTSSPISFHWQQEGIANLTSSPITFNWKQEGIANLTSSPITFHWQQEGIANLTSSPITFHWQQEGIANLTSSPITFHWQENGIANLTSSPITFHWQENGIANLTSSPINYAWKGLQFSQVKPDLAMEKVHLTPSSGANKVHLNVQESDKNKLNGARQPLHRTVGSTDMRNQRERIQPSISNLALAQPSILKPAEKEQLRPNAYANISVRVKVPGNKVVWEMEYKPFDRQSFAPISPQIKGMSGTANSTLLSGRALLADPGEYRLRFRVDMSEAKWSSWRSFTVGELTVNTVKKAIKTMPTVQPAAVSQGITKNKPQIQPVTSPATTRPQLRTQPPSLQTRENRQ